MKWAVYFKNKKVEKLAEQLDGRVLLSLQLLIDNLKTFGPAPGRHWFNYGKLHGKQREDKRHCHLIKGNPTYVCCWEVYKVDKRIEVYYVGTHENAPY
jgi:hypothetical protein